VDPSLYDDIRLVGAISGSLIHVELQEKWRWMFSLAWEGHSPMRPCKFRLADTLERLNTIVSRSFHSLLAGSGVAA
jgi:hypothetical protein